MSLKSSLILALKPFNGSLSARTSSATLPRITATVCNSRQTRCNSTSATTPQVRISAFEQAMMEIHGEHWKNKLSKREHARVRKTEHSRDIFRMHLEKGEARMWNEGQAQSDEEWRAHVDRIKKERLEKEEKWKLEQEQRRLKQELEKEQKNKQNGGDEEQ